MAPKPVRCEANRSSGNRDFVIIGVAVGVLLVISSLFDLVPHQLHQRLAQFGGWNGNAMLSLLLLNLALTIYGFRRYLEATRHLRHRVEAERRAESLVSTDPLTGYLNRAAFGAAVDEMLGSGPRAQSVVMFVIDIDGFKSVNELHGHVTGDALLRTTADMIAQILPAGAVTARLGADEFAVAFRFNPYSATRLEETARGVIEAVGRPVELGGVHVHVSGSAGIAKTEPGCSTAESLLRRADIALCAAKKNGRGCYAWFDGTMERELRERNEIEAGLRVAIAGGEIVPYFEPQVDLVSGALHGFEVLARWTPAGKPVISPDRFIGVAEECGLISDLSMAVMRQAFAEARTWDAGLIISVNISPTQLKDPWLAQKVLKLLIETGFPADRLEVEITESALFENLGLAQSIISSLKNQGVRIALDDFGTGYSSLAHLRALPFDRIKIDRSFVSSMTIDAESEVIVSAIARMAESLGLALTAEGIETQETADRLREIGTFKGQGWLFGKPMPVGFAREMLRSNQLLPLPSQLQPTPRPAPRMRRFG